MIIPKGNYTHPSPPPTELPLPDHVDVLFSPEKTESFLVSGFTTTMSVCVYTIENWQRMQSDYPGEFTNPVFPPCSDVHKLYKREEISLDISTSSIERGIVIVAKLTQSFFFCGNSFERSSIMQQTFTTAMIRGVSLDLTFTDSTVYSYLHNFEG